MADIADIANDLIANEVSNVLKSRAETPVEMGPELCVECEESIPLVRRKLGFDLCVPCAEEVERRQALFAV
ncbi:MAG: TraR/DksA family transcriptional regulator [Gammaproteobacteria bacterium]|nr:TraR/DksA family transcriptional regulator [Gammaproteobacteria bacterium]